MYENLRASWNNYRKPSAASMPLPKVVRVLGRDIPVKVYPADEMPKAFGEYDYETQIVRIKEGQQPAFEADTLLHELVHAMDDAMQLNMRERQVHCIAVGIVALFKDNADFAEYFLKAIRT